MSARGWLQLLLFGVSGGLALVLQDVTTKPIMITTNPPALTGAAPPPMASAAAFAFAMPALESLAATRDRPLFSPSRRPPGPDAGEAGAPAGDAANLVLLGTLTAPGGGRALLRLPDGQTGAWLGVGDTAGGWRVVSIDKDSVEVEADGRRLELTLYPTKVLNNL